MKIEQNNLRKFSVSILNAEHLAALQKIAALGMGDPITRIYVYADFFLKDDNVTSALKALATSLPQAEWVLALPEILRMQDDAFLEKVRDSMENSLFTGVLTGNMEGLGYFIGMNFRIFGDPNLYLWNSGSVSLLQNSLAGGCLPLELTAGEQQALMEKCPDFSWEKMVYGRIPMMLTANCIAKTAGFCHAKEQIFLKDRMGKSLPVRLVCDHCFNVIHNSVPLSLHEEVPQLPKELLLRIQLTTEGEAQAFSILSLFFTGKGVLPFSEFTKGHEKKGTP